MFTRIAEVSKKGRIYRYLKLLENRWVDGKTVQRVVANFGNVEKLDVKKIDSAIASLLRFSSGFFKDIRKIKTLNVKHLGPILAGEKLWDMLGMTQILNDYIPRNHLQGHAVLLIKIMVLSRLIEPESKLSLSENYKNYAISDLENNSFDSHHFYLAMDELIPHKEKIEIALHEREKDLFSLKLNMVFYDLTSSYFEGDYCPLAKHGYSRDHRRDRKQIAIGLLVTNEGLPIAHQVYNGNTNDASTLLDQVNRLKRRFGIKQCVLVVDRGMVTEENLAKLVAQGYQYIVAIRKRKRALFEPVLKMGRDLMKPVDGQEDLLGFETTIDDFGTDRALFFYNADKAKVEARHRQERLDKVTDELKRIQALYESGKRKDKAKLLQQAARYLERKKMTRFFQIDMDERSGIAFTINRDKISFESELDGLFVLRTNRDDLRISEVVASYKTLARAERAFKELKDFVDLRPMYHWAQDRVLAHIFICVLAYLIEIGMEIQLKRSGVEMTARKALNHLSEIKLVNQEIEGVSLNTYSQPGKDSRSIIKALGIKLPKENLFVK